MKIFPAGFSAFGCFFQTTFPAQRMRKKFCRLLYFMQFRQGGESEARSALDAKKGIGLKPQWTNEQAKAQRIEYAASVPKPMKLTRAEAQAKQSEILAQRRLTYDRKRGKIQEREYVFHSC